MVPRHRLAAHGPEFSRLAYGTWRLLNDTTPPTPQSVLARLQRCADLGITTIDTAEIYGRYQVEEALGAALALDKGLRQRLEIVTKAGIYVPNAFHPARKVSYYDATGARLIKSLEKSLRFLGVGHVELLLVHRPDWLTHPDETAEGLNRLLKDGKIRSAGVSNYNVHQFDALNARMDEPLVTNQVEFSLLRMDPIFDGVLDHCMRLGVSPMAWSPLGGGPPRAHGRRGGRAGAAGGRGDRRAPRRRDGGSGGVRVDHGASVATDADHRLEPGGADRAGSEGGNDPAHARGLVCAVDRGAGEADTVGDEGSRLKDESRLFHPSTFPLHPIAARSFGAAATPHTAP
jgi:predicted oxidoreductase